METTNTQLGEVVDEKKVLSLPLNGRSYIDLLGLQAGVRRPLGVHAAGPAGFGQALSAGNISVNGQRETANAFLVNGGDVSEGRNLGAAVIPNLDSVAEFRLITNSFDAEYGKFSGAIMNAITKSGTNGFHGSAFEFLRNDKLDARNFFDPEKGVFKRNQFGYAIGGPLSRTRFSGSPTIKARGTFAEYPAAWWSCPPWPCARAISPAPTLLWTAEGEPRWSMGPSGPIVSRIGLVTR